MSGGLTPEVEAMVTGSSAIRKMFEEGRKMKAEFGADNVFDFSLGNPIPEPPAGFMKALKDAVESDESGTHRYMPNHGLDSCRTAVAGMVNGLQQGAAVNKDHVAMTVGAAGAMNCILKCLVQRGDEVVVVTPYFPEYRWYIDNVGGVMKLAGTDAEFNLDPAQVKAALSPKTRIVLICSPNNPTGRVFTHDRVTQLARILEEHSAAVGRPVFLLNDYVYARLVYEPSARVGNVFAEYKNSILAGSFSKDISLAGERLGYLAINDRCEFASNIMDGLGTIIRTLGFVNAPALMQRALAKSIDATVDMDWYATRRDTLYNGLISAGIHVVKPEGSFFMLAKVPGGSDDDVAFVDALRKHKVLCVPGRGFAAPGYIRLSYSCDMATITNSIPKFKAAADEFVAGLSK
eukprot:TRINITY_DN10395_c0_g2_i2.p1 TRINITY_DN10395_c0_g2~~TRINITY_DN10395_c0_g2_i2.p1  ORF type:complete len:405 (+),score=122.65 TRINITY_DN10395_c0_g2_i2:41-1255(+)